MPDLSALIERVEALTGPSRDADYRIEKAIVRPGEFPASEIWPPFTVGSKFERSIPAYTASIDAAVALVKRVLPGQEWSAGSKDSIGNAWGKVRTAPLKSVQDSAATPAIALVLAALRAVEAQEGRDG